MELSSEKIRTSHESLQTAVISSDRFAVRAHLLRMIQESVCLLQLLDEDELEQVRKRREAQEAAIRAKEAALRAEQDRKLAQHAHKINEQAGRAPSNRVIGIIGLIFLVLVLIISILCLPHVPR